MKKGLFTILFGAGLGAAAIIFSSKDNRKRITQAYNDFMNSVDDKLDEIESYADQAQSTKATNGVHKLKDLLN